MLRYFCVTFALLVSFLAAGLTDEELSNLREHMAETTKACMKEYDVTVDDFEKSKKDKDISNIDPCFIGCLMKRKGLIDDKGMFDEKRGIELAEKIIKSPDEIARVKKVSESCKSVNEQAVSDGEQGCERAVLVLQCYIENKSQVV